MGGPMNDPVLIVCAVKRQPSGEAVWTRIGAAYPHEFWQRPHHPRKRLRAARMPIACPERRKRNPLHCGDDKCAKSSPGSQTFMSGDERKAWSRLLETNFTLIGKCTDLPVIPTGCSCGDSEIRTRIGTQAQARRVRSGFRLSLRGPRQLS